MSTRRNSIYPSVYYRYAITIAVVLLVICALPVVTRIYAKNLAERTTRRLVKRGAEICRMIDIVSTNRYATAVSDSKSITRDGTYNRALVIAYSRTNGQSVAYIVFDWASGDLLRVMSNLPNEPQTNTAPLRTDEIQLASNRWMKQLGVATKAGVWHLVERPERVVNGWEMAYESPDRIVHITVSGQSGQLIQYKNTAKR